MTLYKYLNQLNQQKKLQFCYFVYFYILSIFIFAYCSRSSTPILSLDFFCKHPSMSFFRSALTTGCYGKTRGCFMIFVNSYDSLLPYHGNFPYNISYITTPNDQISDL